MTQLIGDDPVDGGPSRTMTDEGRPRRWTQLLTTRTPMIGDWPIGSDHWRTQTDPVTVTQLTQTDSNLVVDLVDQPIDPVSPDWPGYYWYWYWCGDWPARTTVLNPVLADPGPVLWAQPVTLWTLSNCGRTGPSWYWWRWYYWRTQWTASQTQTQTGRQLTQLTASPGPADGPAGPDWRPRLTAQPGQPIVELTRTDGPVDPRPHDPVDPSPGPGQWPAQWLCDGVMTQPSDTQLTNWTVTQWPVTQAQPSPDEMTQWWRPSPAQTDGKVIIDPDPDQPRRMTQWNW